MGSEKKKGTDSRKKVAGYPENARGFIKKGYECVNTITCVIVSVYLFLMIAVLPFYYQDGYNHIGTDKSYFFRTCTIYACKILMPVLALDFLFLVIRRIQQSEEGSFSPYFSITDVFVLLYACSVFLSYCCTNYRDTALWGEGGWYMGAVPQLFLVGIYFCVSRFWHGKWLFYLFLPVSAAVFLLGLVNRFGWYPIPMEHSELPLFISTIGNINWYCGYLSAVLFVGVGMFWLDSGGNYRRKILYFLYMLIGFATLVTQGSDSGIFACVLVMLALFVLSAGEARQPPESREAGCMGRRSQDGKQQPPELREAGCMGRRSQDGKRQPPESREAGCMGRRSQDGKRQPPESQAAGDIGGVARFWQIALGFSLACLAVFVVRGISPDRLDYTTGIGNLLTYSMFPAGMTILSLGMLYILRENKNQVLFNRGNKNQVLFKAHKLLAKIISIAVPTAALLFAGLIVLNTLRPGSLGRFSAMEIFTFGPTWGSNRGATWGAGARCWLEQDLLHKLVGLGPDCMWAYISRDGSEALYGMVRDTFGEGNRLTNAHCEWLTALVHTGVLGCAGYAGMMLSAAVRYLRRRAESSLAAACGLCLLAYAANSLWSFQQSMGAATIFVLLGMGEVALREAEGLADAPVK